MVMSNKLILEQFFDYLDLSKIKKRSSVLTFWLAILIIYNGYQFLFYTPVLLYLSVTEKQIDYDSEEVIKLHEENNSTPEETKKLLKHVKLWASAYLLVRVVSICFLVMILLLKQYSLHAYCFISLIVFAVDLWGDDNILEASADLILPAILIAIIRNNKQLLTNDV